MTKNIFGGNILKFMQNMRLIRWLIGAKVTSKSRFLSIKGASRSCPGLLEVVFMLIYSSKYNFWYQNHVAMTLRWRIDVNFRCNKNGRRRSLGWMFWYLNTTTKLLHGFFIWFYTVSASFWYPIYLGSGLRCQNEVKFKTPWVLQVGIQFMFLAWNFSG